MLRVGDAVEVGARDQFALVAVPVVGDVSTVNGAAVGEAVIGKVAVIDPVAAGCRYGYAALV